ncbi:MAG: type II toxin-antitoxin system VapC family toxin [Burkholderiales bacterium]
MRVLLDTQAFLWWVFADSRLSRRASKVLADEDNDCLLSMASVWELAIKAASGKIKLNEPIAQFIPSELRANGFSLLDIRFAHVSAIEQLPQHHRDPFDRLIVAQAIVEDLPVMSVDSALDSYEIERIW